MSMQNAKNINQKEYLKKYLSGDKEKKKKKKDKKHKKSTQAKVKIIDDDAHDVNNEELDEDLLLGGEDAPQIVGEYIEENPDAFRSKWRNIAVKDEPKTEPNSEQNGNPEHRIKQEPADDESDLWGRKASTVKIKQERSPSHGEYNNGHAIQIKIKQEKRSSSRDQSPARIASKGHDRSPRSKRRNSDQSPPRGRRDERDSSQRNRQDSDQSPPRRRADSDQSPQRKNRNADQSPPRRRHGENQSQPRRRRSSDQSPPRRRREQDQSPLRKRRSSDQSPPRRRKDSDQSPPRRKQESNKSPRRRRPDEDQSPPRKRRDADQSPPRRRNDRDHSPPSKRRSSDQSPPRRRRDGDTSPPRRQLSVDISPPRRRRSNSRNRRDQSPPRRVKKEEHLPAPERKSRWAKVERSRTPSPPPTHKPKSDTMRTLDGKKAGLQDAQSLKKETNERRREEMRMFDKMSNEVSGRDAEVQIRSTGRRGKRARDAAAEDPVERKRKEEHEQKKKELYDRWGKGLKQLEDQRTRHAEMAHEAAKPVARYANDEDLDRHLREQEHADDPMLEYMRKKRKNREQQSNKPVLPVYEGSYPENRFGIRPGYRWDGVDRSNGYEKRWFDKQNERRALQDEAYKYSVEDM